MLETNTAIERLQNFGVGRRSLDDELFNADKPPARLSIFDEDEEDVCYHTVRSACTVPGCAFAAASLLQLEQHYNAAHRYSCSACRRALPSPHLLDLHVQETHDSFFAAMAARKPSYCCYIQECTKKFINSTERLEHCIKVHKVPKDFRFENKVIEFNKSNNKKSQSSNMEAAMDTDTAVATGSAESPQFYFHNSKRKGMTKYSGKKFTSDNSPKTKESSVLTNMDQMMIDLRETLSK